MRKNLKYKVISGLIPALLISCNSGTQTPSENQIKLGAKTVSSEQLTATNHGEIIYLYKSVDDKVPQRMLTNLDKTDLNNILLDDNSEKLHIRTYVMVKETTDYQFLPDMNNAQVFINSKPISGKINLLANNLYALDIIIKKSSLKSKLDLTWIKTTSANTKPEKIPLANLYLPTENIFAPSLNKGSKTSFKSEELPEVEEGFNDLTDTSKNGIPDDWSINGYTSVIKNGMIVVEKWDDKIHLPMKKTKFYSSPLKWSTAGDPYSDYQKVTGIGLDNSIAKEARNPLVAAYPEISVELDGMVISKNQKVTDTTNGSTTNTLTVTKSTAELTQHSNKIGVGLSGDFASKPKFLGGLINIAKMIKPSVSYEYNKITSTTITDSTANAEAIMEGWINAIEINDAQAAYLTPLVHYYNRGTAPAYNVKPKYNLAYKDLNDQIVSLKTIEAQEAEQANLIAPNLSYPKNAQDSLVVASNNMSLITINKKQLETLEKTKEVFLNNLETTASLSLKLGNNDSKLVDWTPYLNEINNSTALIELATPDGSMLSRRAVARPVNKSENLLESLNPELSLDEALRLIYNFDMTESKMENSDYIYYGFIFNVTGNKNLDEVRRQLKENGNNLGNVKLKIGMIFTIIPDGLAYDKNTNKYYYYESGIGTLLQDLANLPSDKYYYIKSYKQDLYFNVWQASNADYASIVAHPMSIGSFNTQFRFIKNNDGAYNIIARHSGKAVLIKYNSNNDNADLIQHITGAIPLTQPNASFDAFYEKGKIKFRARNSGKCLQNTGDRSNIKQFTCSNIDSQLWELVDEAPPPVLKENKYYYIKNYNQNLYFNVSQASNTDGAPIIAYQFHFGALNTQFKFINNKKGAYNIIVRHNGKGLHIDQGSVSDGANLVQYRTNPIPSTQTNASFDILYEKGKIKFRVRNSNKCLQRIGANSSIQQYTCSNADSQLWELVDAEISVSKDFSKKNIMIQNVYSGLFADIAGGYFNPGTRIIQYSAIDYGPNGSPNQRFNIEYIGEFDGRATFKIAPTTKTDLIWDNANYGNHIFLQKDYTGSTSPAHTWWIYDNGDGSYSFMNRGNMTKILNLENCSKNGYEKLKLQDVNFSCNDGSSYKWRIIQ